MQLDSAAVAAGVRLVAYETLGSTNAQAMARARDGERGPLWITAARQSAGRGRRGRSWISDAGNLYASLLLSDAAPPERLPELCFVTALAVRDAVCSVAPQLSHLLWLKWPNDLLLDGAKMSGILIEAEQLEACTAGVVGIGINVAHHPVDTPYVATDLAAAGVVVSPSEMFAALSAAMLERLAVWRRGEGFAEIRSAWLAHAAGVGSAIVVRLQGHELTGTFESLDPDGRLMLRQPSGRLEAITAGDVFPLLTQGGQ